MADAILTLNGGSSSIKFALFEVAERDTLRVVSRGSVESIGGSPHFIARDGEGKPIEERRWQSPPAFDDLLGAVIGWAEDHLGGHRLAAVGHRVVHGGREHVRPERVTPELLDVLRKLTPIAPLHEPHNLAPMTAIAALRKEMPQVACFDTAFHHTMPTVATRFALPRDLEEAGIRRYGFHGLSYEYIAEVLHAAAPALSRGRVIAAHLGNGASFCAMKGGRSVDTTMGFTALDGLVMGTRCGSLDPGVVIYLQRELGLGVEAVEDMLYHRSGLLGVSGGIDSDMRALLSSPDERAGEAVELFVFRIAREVGALASSLGGIDGLVFTAGIGEHAPQIRAAVCERLRWLGVSLDAGANAKNSAIVSGAGSKVEVRVVPTDEEMMIARHTLRLLRS